MLCDALASHPQISCQHELFSDWGKRQNYRAALDEFPGPVVVGHAHFAQLHSSMLVDDIKRILLVRKNTLNGALSAMLMQSPRPNGLYLLDPRHIAVIKDERALQTALMMPYADLVVSYEDLTGDQNIADLPEEHSRRLCEFLGVDYYPLTTMTVKRPPMRPRNLDELANA